MTRSFCALVMSALVLLAACGGSVSPTPTIELSTPLPQLATPDSQLKTAPSYLTDFVFARNVVGGGFMPVDQTDEFEPTDTTIHAVATLDDAPPNLTLRVVWTLVSAEGYAPNDLINETTVNIEQAGSRNVDFKLTGEQPQWPSGVYRADLYIQGQLADSREFRVTGVSATPVSGYNPVIQTVLAEDIEPETFAPINPTRVFKTTAPDIHATVQIQDALPNTVFRARWSPPNQDPLEFSQRTDGSRWLDFSLEPAPDGFPPGEYRLELFVNDNLVDTQTFIVE